MFILQLGLIMNVRLIKTLAESKQNVNQQIPRGLCFPKPRAERYSTHAPHCKIQSTIWNISEYIITIIDLHTAYSTPAEHAYVPFIEYITSLTGCVYQTKPVGLSSHVHVCSHACRQNQIITEQVCFSQWWTPPPTTHYLKRRYVLIGCWWHHGK